MNEWEDVRKKKEKQVKVCWTASRRAHYLFSVLAPEASALLSNA